MEEACRRGDLAAIQSLVVQDPDNITRPDAIGITPLHRVAAANHLHIARFLVAKGANVNALDKYQDAPLKKAAFRGFSDFVVFLVLNGADVNHKDGSGKIALHHSAEQGQLQSVEVMLDARADVSAVSAEGFTPLHLAAQNGHAWCCKALIVAGAYVDARGGRSASTALHLAAEKGHKFTVQLLMAERADVNIPDGQQRKPFSVSKGGIGGETFAAFQSPFVKSMCHGPSCTAEGPGVHGRPRADDACMFLIVPRDRYGVILRDELGLLNFTVDCEEVASGLSVPAKVIPNSRMGNHVCYYDASKIGDYRIHVHLEDFKTEGEVGTAGRRVACAGSPYLIRVLPAPMDMYATRAKGPGVTEVRAGSKTVFTVFGRDRFQNPSSEGDLSVVMLPLNRPPSNLEIVDSGDGTYLVSYIAPPECGVYAISVTLAGRRHIYNSPFTVFVSPGEVFLKHCVARGRGLVKGGKNLPMRFHIQTADGLGNALTHGGLSWKVTVHHLLGPNQEYQKVPATPRNGSDDERSTSSGDEGEEGQEAASERAGGGLVVSGLESEVERFGKEVSCATWDHRNGTYSFEYTPAHVGRHKVDVELVLPGGATEAVAGSPFYPLINSIAEWDVEEVALFIERIGFPELVRHFVLRKVTGQHLCALTETLLEEDLAISNKSLQRTLLYLIEQELKTPVVLEAVQGINELSLAQMGVLDRKERERIVGFISQTTENTSEAIEREEAFQSQLKKRLTNFGTELQDVLRLTLEDTMSEFTDQILNDWANGKYKENLQGVRDALKELEQTIQDKFEFETRINATLTQRNATQEELAAGITDEELDETEPLFLPPPTTPPGKYMREEANKQKRGTPGSAGQGERKKMTVEEREKARAEKEKARQVEQLLAEASGSEDEDDAAGAGGRSREGGVQDGGGAAEESRADEDGGEERPGTAADAEELGGAAASAGKT